MPIFVGVRWIRGIKKRVGSSKIAIFASCGCYMFPQFIYETKIITSEYVVPQWLFIDIDTDDLEYRKTSNTSRVSNRSRVPNTSRGSRQFVLIEAGSRI